MKYVQYGFLGAAILGMVGFLGGFFGPMIFMPESNQGPMFGIFISGPLVPSSVSSAGSFLPPSRSNPPPRETERARPATA